MEFSLFIELIGIATTATYLLYLVRELITIVFVDSNGEGGAFMREYFSPATARAIFLGTFKGRVPLLELAHHAAPKRALADQRVSRHHY
jgi:hypothetical protein